MGDEAGQGAAIELDLSEVRDFLRGALPFNDLDGALLEEALASLRVSYHRHGERFDARSERSGLRILRAGAVDLRDRENKLLDRLGEGESFHIAGLNAERGEVLALVIEDALIYRLPEEVYGRLRRANRGFDRYFSGQRSRRLRRAARFQAAPNGMLVPVRSLMSEGLLTVGHDRSIRDVASAMAQRRVSSALVVDGDGNLCGIVTDRDLRTRVIAAALDIAAPVSEVMTRNPLSIPAEDTIFAATLLMTQRNFHHLPVTDAGRLAGIVTSSDLVLARRDDPVYVVQHISRQDRVEGLHDVVGGMGHLVAQWVASDMRAQQVSRILTAISDAVTTRLIQLAEADLGPAPGPWTWLSFGSQARAEQLLGADQDNGILIDDRVRDEDLGWYEEIAKRVCEGLAICGYPRCPGAVMATTDAWRQRLSTWKDTVRSWTRTPTGDAVMRVSIFFDIRGVYGDTALVDALQQEMLAQAGSNTIFQAALAASILDRKPPLGIFRRFVVDRDGEHRDTLDVKQRAILPVTEIARLHALAHGVAAVNTQERLEALAQAEYMAIADSRNLVDALHVVQRIRMEHQRDQILVGDAPDNYVQPRRLARLEREHLRDAFTIIDEAQAAVRQTYRAGLG